MKSLVLLLSFVGLFSCEPPIQPPSDAAGRASGRYAVQAYVVDGDTIYSATGTKRFGTRQFYVDVGRVAPDSVVVSTVHTKGDFSLNAGKYAFVEEANGTFQLSNRYVAPSTYESRIEGNLFYERTSGRGVNFLGVSWLIDSLGGVANFPNEAIITARK